MRGPASYAEPFAWWGPVWNPGAARSVVDLVRDGTVSAETAGLLWTLLDRRASLVVVAAPSGAGKTTLLTALLDLFPVATRRLYLRGCYEPFAFLDDPTIDPQRAVLLVNEVSAHLPVYLWGSGVRRTLDAVRLGFALAATAHAAEATDLVRLLTGYPLRVPLAAVAAFHLVVALDAWADGESVRREVASVTALGPPAGGGGLGLVPLAVRAGRGHPSVVDPRAASGVVSRLGGPADERTVRREIDDRAAVLATLAAAPLPTAGTTPLDLAAAWERSTGIG